MGFRGTAIAAVALVSGCSLVVDVDGYSSPSSTSPVTGAPDAAVDAGSAGPVDAGADTDVAPTPIVVLQHHGCAYKSAPKTFGCTFATGNTAGSAFLVHYYFNYADSALALSAVTDDNGNAYSFLDVGGTNCPAGGSANQACCTASGAEGTCQGWAVVTNAKTSPKSTATITFTLAGGASTNIVMGAQILEVSGLADAPLDRGASAVTAPGAVVTTPTIAPTAAGELLLAGVVFYTSSSTLTEPPDWRADQDTGYFAATLFRVGGAAGTTYGGSSMGAITGMTKAGTSTIVALRAR